MCWGVRSAGPVGSGSTPSRLHTTGSRLKVKRNPWTHRRPISPSASRWRTYRSTAAAHDPTPSLAPGTRAPHSGLRGLGTVSFRARPCGSQLSRRVCPFCGGTADRARAADRCPRGVGGRTSCEVDMAVRGHPTVAPARLRPGRGGGWCLEASSGSAEPGSRTEVATPRGWGAADATGDGSATRRRGGRVPLGRRRGAPGSPSPCQSGGRSPRPAPGARRRPHRSRS